MIPPARKARWRGVGEWRDEAEPLLERPGDIAGVIRGRPRSMLMACPDGCGDTLVINLDPRAGKAWTFDGRRETASLYPSVWREDGCRSHFILWRDHIIWCSGRHVAENEEPVYDRGLETAVLEALDTKRYRGAWEVARELDEIGWDVTRALRKLVKDGRVEEGKRKDRDRFRRKLNHRT